MINDFENFGLYNNIKGTIINITHENNQFKFYIELDNNIKFNCVISNEIEIESSGGGQICYNCNKTCTNF